MNFNDIPQFPFASYTVNVSWDYLEKWLQHQNDRIMNLDMDPFYQRGYVWSLDQKIAYLEYQLRGGFSGRDIFWNCPTWMRFNSESNTISLVDGKQRISAVLDFLNNKVEAFDKYFSEFEDTLGMDPNFVFHINNLQTEKEVVEWYLGLNIGGSIHTEKDLKPALDFLNSGV